MRAKRWLISSLPLYVRPLAMSNLVDILLISSHFLLTLQNRFHTWRKLWLNLAIAEKQLGLPIPADAIEQMNANLVRLTLIFQSSPMC